MGVSRKDGVFICHFRQLKHQSSSLRAGRDKDVLDDVSFKYGMRKYVSSGSGATTRYDAHHAAVVKYSRRNARGGHTNAKIANFREAAPRQKKPGDAVDESPPTKKAVLQPVAPSPSPIKPLGRMLPDFLSCPGPAPAMDTSSASAQAAMVDRSHQDWQQYEEDAFRWKVAMQKRFRLGCRVALSSQEQLTPEMRSKLLMWLASVNRQFKFSCETFMLTANMLDRFLSIQPIDLDCFQLLGVCSFFIAAKFEEMDPPRMSELVNLCAGCYDAKHFKWMEVIILTLLQFQVFTPTMAFFLFSHVNRSQLGCIWPRDLTRDLLERCVGHEWISNLPQSKVALAIFQLIQKHLFHLPSQDCLFQLLMKHLREAINIEDDPWFQL